MRISDWSSDVCSSDLHHEPRHGLFEKNDWFAVMFAIPSILCFLAGVRLGWGDAWTWVGGGIAAYGAIYFGFHDVLVHQRISHRSEEHTSELQSLMRISYAVFCLKKKKNIRKNRHIGKQREIV